MIEVRYLPIAGRRRRLALETDFWSALNEIGGLERQPIERLCAVIQERNPGRRLEEAIRVFVLNYYAGHLAGLQAAGEPARSVN